MEQENMEKEEFDKIGQLWEKLQQKFEETKEKIFTNEKHKC